MTNETFKIPSKEQRVNARSSINQTLNSDPSKLWYEIITNIPLQAKRINWIIEVKKGYMDVTYRQDFAGPSLETLVTNMASEETTLDSVRRSKTKPDSGGIFGTGLQTIADYTHDTLLLTSYPSKGSPFSFSFETDKITNVVNDYTDYGFELKMKIPYTNRLHSYKDFINKLRQMISDYDSENMLLNREHLFSVSGLKSTTEDIEASLPIKIKEVSWVDEMGNPSKTPKLNGLDDGTKILPALSIESVASDDNIVSVSINNIRLGKRDKDYKLEGFDGDKPMLVIYYEESKQVAFIIPLRRGNGETSLNNVLVIGTIKKNELALFLNSTDKKTGVTSIFTNTLRDTLRPYILRTYPDNNLVEKGSQLFVKDVIVNDKGGKRSAEGFRSDVGLSPMDSMTPEERDEITKLEVSRDSDRYDILVYMVWLTGGKMTKNTPIWIAENKRKDFNRNDRNQVFGYVLKNGDVRHAVAISNSITSPSFDAWKSDISAIQRAGRLDDVTFTMIDVADYGFNENATFTYYLNLAQQNKI
jgi:hypothetical protein